MKSLSDITAPATVKRKLLEKDVQKQCVDWARARGYWARKFSSIAQRSVPDYLFSRVDLYGAHRLFAVEFKAPGKKPTEAQMDEMQKMREAGWEATWFDNVAEFKEYLQVCGGADPL
jgi:hypothetical protein